MGSLKRKRSVKVVSKSKIILIVMVIFSWITIPFIGWKDIRRFVPSSLFISFILMILSYLGTKRKWWVFKTKINPNINPEFPFIIGPFLAGSLWIFKLTYGNFLKYISYNTVLDLLFSYPLTWIFNKLNIFSLKRLSHFRFFLMFYSTSFLMYGFQKLFGQKEYFW